VEQLAREPVARDLDGLIAQLEGLAAQAEEWGVCVPGLVEEGTVHYAANLPLRDTPLLELLTPRPRVFVNDLVAATVGGLRGTLALLQINRTRPASPRRTSPSRQRKGRPSAFRDEGPLCRCGNRGCVEAYCGSRQRHR
jgi:predicted NBD/HSP70 family sugar kinase